MTSEISNFTTTEESTTNFEEHTMEEPVSKCSIEHFDGLSEDLSKYEWQDVSDLLKNASQQLNVGELVSDSTFSLFEAMSAIELMDPKMDAGMDRENFRKVDFNQALENRQIWLTNFTPQQLVQIIDSSLATLISWLEGHSLAQTIFINLFLHNPAEIECRLMRTFSYGILKIVGLVDDIIRQAAVFEDEDFHMLGQNFDLASDIPLVRTVTALRIADEESIRLSKVAKSSNDLTTANEYELLSLRFQLIRSFIISIISLTVQGEEKPSATNEILPKWQNFKEATKQLHLCQENLTKILASLPPAHNDSSTITLENVFGFFPNLNQHLLPPTFIRKLYFLPAKSVFEYFSQLIDRLLIACQLSDYASINFDAILDFYRDFSRHESCVLSRSILQIAIMPTDYRVINKIPFVDLVKDAVRDFVNPPVLNSAINSILLNDPICRPLIDDFFNNCAKICHELLRITGHNRARQRDCYAVVLEDFATFQENADRLDSHLHAVLNESGQSGNPIKHHLARLGSYVLYHVLKCMSEYLMLGFELDLYAPHEYSYVFWYLNEFLLKWTVNVLHKIDSTLYEQEIYSNKSEKVGTSKKKTLKQQKMKKSGGRSHRFEILRVQAYQKMCDAYHRAIMGFHSAGRISTPCFSESDQLDSVRYEHRFAPFFHLSTPTMITYKQYLDISSFKEIVANIGQVRLFTDAANCFDEARIAFETIPLANEKENANVVKLCKNNAVVLRLLATGKQDAVKEWPRFDFSVHKSYPVIKLK